MRNRLLVFFISIMWSFASDATIELTEQLSISGFGSTSWAKSDNETAVIINHGISDSSCFDCDTTFGIQLDYFNDAFKASVQLVKRPQDNWSEPELEWAYAGYSVNNFEFRAGRLRLPIFLLSEYYYVNHAYTSTRPPEEVYNSILGITAYTGASIVWSTELFEQYQLLVTPFVGIEETNTIDITPTLDVSLDIDKMAGINFVFSADYYRWNFTYFTSDFTQTVQLTNAIPGIPYLEIPYEEQKLDLYSLGFEYELGQAVLTSERQISNIRSTWYASLAYRMGKFTPYISYGENDAKTGQFSSYGGKTGSSFITGLRYNVKYNISVNAEWQQFKSYAGQRGSFVEVPMEPDANLYTIMLNFVF